MRSVGAANVFAKGAIGVYLAAGLACFGIAGYMAFGEQRPLMSVAVIAPAVGGLWFFIRVFMTATNSGPKG
ncbi:MAG: hypothetical protein JNJ73_11865 [Hyphomonadaceae bacterium]|nr:hypothetical protein [Hyphomonadaceae bacterium]